MNKDEFCKTWLKTFAKGISKDKLDKCIFDYRYIWHIFSFELLPKEKYLSGDEARNKFDSILKYSSIDNSPLADVLVFFDNNETISINSTCDNSNKLDDFIEIYVIGKDFKWTYIKTHEDGCGLGPYYMEIDS